MSRLSNLIKKAVEKARDRFRFYLVGRIKETLSIPAPRKRTRDRKGNVYYRATTRAKKGAPPRKVSGKLRAGVHSKATAWNEIVIAVRATSPEGFPYGKHHEIKDLRHRTSGLHPYVAPTVAEHKKVGLRFVKEEMRIALRGAS